MPRLKNNKTAWTSRVSKKTLHIAIWNRNDARLTATDRIPNVPELRLSI